MSIVQKCMAIMSIIITEEDLCKKLAKKCAKICQFSSLPSKCFQAVNDPNTENDSKPHICAYNYNTRTGFRDHKKTWGPRVLSSTLLPTPLCEDPCLLISELLIRMSVLTPPLPSQYPGLRNKIIMVTGAGSGIGEATAKYFAHQGCRSDFEIAADFL